PSVPDLRRRRARDAGDLAPARRRARVRRGGDPRVQRRPHPGAVRRAGDAAALVRLRPRVSVADRHDRGGARRIRGRAGVARARGGGLKFRLAFAGWATLAFVPAWAVSHAWQRLLGALAARFAAPPGSTLEMVDLELFYPVDVAVFVALCLASGWAPWR